MEEPTFKQHKKLQEANEMDLMRTGKEDDIDLIYELVRGGYMNNLVMLGGAYEWRFVITEKGEEYLRSV